MGTGTGNFSLFCLYRNWYRTNLVPEKSLRTGIGKIGPEKSTGIGIGNIWYRKKVSVSVSFNILGTVTHCKEERSLFLGRWWVKIYSD